MDFFTKSVEFDVSKSIEMLGAYCKTSIENGVANTAQWYKENNLL